VECRGVLHDGDHAMTVDWAEVSALATALYGVAFVLSLGLVLIQLRRQADERFVTSTQPTFEIWMSDEFQRAQQWILYELQESTWRDFTAHHRNDYGERALLRVGSYYNRIGYLVVYRLLGSRDGVLLDTVAGSAIAVWNKIEPLILEARLMENATMFVDYERMLPECYECYVPNQPVPAHVLEEAAEAARLAGD
jgi:hypothetical protein